VSQKILKISAKKMHANNKSNNFSCILQKIDS
jgi:hypothetical protein